MSPDALTPAEFAALHRAAELAEYGAATALPNPVVGCVLLAPGGWTVGEGYHRRPGGPHAEVAALTAAGPLARAAPPWSAWSRATTPGAPARARRR